MRFAGVLFLLLGLLLLPANAYAESNVNIISADLKYNDINTKLNKINQNIKNSNVDYQALSEDTLYLRETRVKLESSRQDIEISIQQVEKRVEALGEAPADGNEVSLITQKRRNENEIKGLLFSRYFARGSASYIRCAWSSASGACRNKAPFG